MLHGGTLTKVRNIEGVIERASNNLLSEIDPIDTERIVAMTQTIHDDIYNYSLPSDYKKIIDLYPQDNRQSLDGAIRQFASSFDLKKALTEKTISIEGSEGSKFLRVNWRSRGNKVIHNMNSVTDNGTWSAVGTTTGIQVNTIFKQSGNASIEFDLVTTGDGIKNTTMSAVDLTDEDEVADFYVWIYFGTVPTSISAKWGNDLTANYWSSTAQTTQADGTALRVGWNLIKFSWASATEIGTVAPAIIDSFQITVVSSAQNNIRVDNIICSIGRPFDIKYYSKFLLKNTSGIWITRTTTDDDIVILDNDAINCLLYECLIESAHQIEGSDSSFDMNHAYKRLYGDKTSNISSERVGLYQKYRGEFPSQSKKAVNTWYNFSRFRR